jgi:hypothetical protein
MEREEEREPMGLCLVLSFAFHAAGHKYEFQYIYLSQDVFAFTY